MTSNSKLLTTQGTPGGFQEDMCPFHQPSKPWALPPPQGPLTGTGPFLQHFARVRLGSEARLLGAYWDPGLGGGAKLVPFYRW